MIFYVGGDGKFGYIGYVGSVFLFKFYGCFFLLLSYWVILKFEEKVCEVWFVNREVWFFWV